MAPPARLLNMRSRPSTFAHHVAHHQAVHEAGRPTDRPALLRVGMSEGPIPGHMASTPGDALLAACLLGRHEQAHELLARGADPNVQRHSSGGAR